MRLRWACRCLQPAHHLPSEAPEAGSGWAGWVGGAPQGSPDSRASSLTPDHLGNLPGAPTCRPGWQPLLQGQDGTCVGGKRPVECSCPTSPSTNPPYPYPAPFLAPPLDTCPTHCSAAPRDSSSGPPRSCKDRRWAGRCSPLVAVGLRHRTSPRVNPHAWSLISAPAWEAPWQAGSATDSCPWDERAA